MKGINLDHFYRLTDNTGILKSSKFGVPDPSEGYTTDDNARALILSVMLYESYQDKKYELLIYKFLSFLLNAQNDAGRFRGHMSYDRRFIEDRNDEESFGRCLWALGYTISAPNVPEGIKETCRYMLERSRPQLDKLESLRSKAYVIIGLSYIAREINLLPQIDEMADSLGRQFKLYSYDGWNWFEDILAYGSAVFTWSFFRAYKVLRAPDYLKIALDSLEFFDKITFSKEGYYKPIGTNGWMPRGQKAAEFDEKPLEAAKAVLAYLEAFYLFKEKKYLEKAKLCLSWFEGNNSQKLILIDEATRGCCDAITVNGLNRDQGAESILLYCIVTQSLQKFLNQQ